MRKALYALTIAALLSVGLFAQQSGGAFVPTFDYTIPSNWTFTGIENFTGTFKIGGTAVTATATELNYTDVTAAGTAQASKALVLGTGKNTDFLQFGTTATAALTTGGGTSAAPLATAVADKNFLGFWTKSTATSGDSRGMYLRHYISGAGGAGEALRAYGTVEAAASAAGTVNGAHVSLSFAATGTAAGASNALRATYDMAESANPGGTAAVMQLDSNFGASTTVPSTMAYLRLDNVGTNPTTNGVPYLLNITNADDGLFVDTAGTGAGECAQTGGVVFAKAIAIRVGSTNYWIPVCTAK